MATLTRCSEDHARRRPTNHNPTSLTNGMAKHRNRSTDQDAFSAPYRIRSSTRRRSDNERRRTRQRRSLDGRADRRSSSLVRRPAAGPRAEGRHEVEQAACAEVDAGVVGQHVLRGRGSEGRSGGSAPPQSPSGRSIAPLRRSITLSTFATRGGGHRDVLLGVICAKLATPPGSSVGTQTGSNELLRRGAWGVSLGSMPAAHSVRGARLRGTRWPQLHTTCGHAVFAQRRSKPGPATDRLADASSGRRAECDGSAHSDLATHERLTPQSHS